MSVFKLPAEIRDQIWHFVVVKHDAPVRVYKYNGRRQGLALDLPPSLTTLEGQWKLKEDYTRATSRLAIAFVCRQSYLEVTPIYYSRNTFLFESMFPHAPGICDWVGFATAIGSERAKYISSISTTSAFHVPLAQRLAPFPNLKRLHVAPPSNLPSDLICRWKLRDSNNRFSWILCDLTVLVDELKDYVKLNVQRTQDLVFEYGDKVIDLQG